MMKVFNFAVIGLIFLGFYQTAVFAQSGKKIEQPAPTPKESALPADANKIKPADQNLEKVRFLISGNLSRFVEELNGLGKLGYRVGKAFNFGGDASESQRFAAVLRLESGSAYEYDWLTSPNKNFLESHLNLRAADGFYPVYSFAITVCGDKTYESDNDSSPAASSILRLSKGDVFLLERKNGDKKKTKDYKVFVGKIGVGKNPSAELQTALDTVSKEYRPFKILFNKSGLIDFSVSVLLEDDLNAEVSRKTDYKFVKEVNGFEKQINAFAQDGYEFLSGRRIGLIKYALMAKNSDGATFYVFADADKYDKELAKIVKPDDVYKRLFTGDSECDSSKTIGEKLVFERSSSSAANENEYKYLRLTDKNDVSAKDETVAEIKNLLANNYELRDVFYSDGIVVIMEKQ